MTRFPAGNSGSCPRRCRTAGFTLLEVIATLMVLAITMSGLIQINHMNLERTVRTTIEEAATLLAQRQMERAILGMDGVTASGDFHDLGEDYSEFVWQRNDEEVTVAGDRKAIRIRVYVMDREARKPLAELATYVPYAGP